MTKRTEQPPVTCEAIARLGRGIGNENRYRIIAVLQQGPQSVGVIADAIDMAQSAVSQHLRVMKEAGLVTTNKQGQVVFYAIDAVYVTKVLQQLVRDVKDCPTT